MAVKSPLALIHCALGRASNWRPFLNALERPVSPLLIELPGHGLAEDYDPSRDFADQAIEIAIDEMPSDPSSAEHATAAKEFHAIWGDGRSWGDLTPDQRAYIVDRIPLIPPGDTLIVQDRSNILSPGRLEDLEMPVTFVDGGDSHPSIPEIISTLGDRIPNAEWVTVPDAGHMVPITHPERVVEAIGQRLFAEPAKLD